LEKGISAVLLHQVARKSQAIQPVVPRGRMAANQGLAAASNPLEITAEPGRSDTEIPKCDLFCYRQGSH